MANCIIDYQGVKYSLEDFKDLLGRGLLYNLLDRGVVDLPINRSQVEPKTLLTGFEHNFVKSKQDVEKSLKEVFKLPAQKAKAVADVYSRVASSWAKRNNRTITDYFKTLSIFKGDEAKLSSKDNPALYNQQELTQLLKEKEDVRSNTKSFKLFKAPNGKRTNLTEDQWLTVQTPTFKKWFGDSKAVDENGEPKVFYHGTLDKFDTFNPDFGGRQAGIFLTPEIDFAVDYGKIPDNVLELFVKAKKLFDYDNASHIEGLSKNSNSNSTIASMLKGFKDEDGWTTNTDDNNWNILERPTVQKFLKENGYDGYYVKEQGIKNLAVYEPNQVKISDGRNQTFLESNPSFLQQGSKGAILLGQDGKDIIYALSNPDISTPLHELAHRWERELNDTERKSVLDWAKHESWTRETSEKFARGFEKYLADGKAPKVALQQIFDRFKQWLVDIYKGIKGSAIDVELNEPMKKVFASMLGEDYSPKLEEQIQHEGAAQPTETTSPTPTVETPVAQPTVIQETPKSEDIQKWNKPYTGNDKDKIIYVLDVSQAFNNGSYDELIANGDMTEAELNEIFKSAGKSSNLARIVTFRATNEGFKYSIDNLLSLSVDPDGKQDFQMLSNHFIASDRFKDALDNDMISPQDASQLLDKTVGQTKEITDKKNELIKLANEKINQEVKVAEQDLKEVKPQSKEEVKETRDLTGDAGAFANKLRSRNITSIEFKKPFLGKNGSKLLSYTWEHEQLIPDEKVTDKSKIVRVSDWSKAGVNVDTGRNIVHKFKIETADGKTLEVSADSLAKALGFSNSELESAFPKVKDITKSIARLSLEEQSLLVDLKNAQDVKAEVVKELENKLGKKIEVHGRDERYNESRIGNPIDETEEGNLTYEFNQAIRKRGLNTSDISEDARRLTKVREQLKNKNEQLNKLYPEESKISEPTKVEPKLEIEEEKSIVPERNISDLEARIAELKRQLADKPKEGVEEVGLDDLPRQENFSYANYYTQVSKDEGIRSERLPKDASTELINRHNIIVKVAERIRKVLPSVPVDLIFDDAQWKGRIKNGRVEVNLNYADRNTPIHEMLHPFVLALREGNSDLHFNLSQELRTSYPEYIDNVKNNKAYDSLSEAEKEEEALVQYLGDKVEQNFAPDGSVDLDKIKTNTPAFQSFYKWLTGVINDFWDRISGGRAGRKISHVRDVDYITYNKDTNKITGYKARSKEERVDEGGNKIKEKDNRTFLTSLTDTDDLNRRGISEDVISQIKEIADKDNARVVNINRSELLLPKKRLEDDSKMGGPGFDVKPSIDVSDLPINFTLQNVVDVIGSQERLSFDFSAQQGAIDKLEAYQFQSQPEMDEFFKKLEGKLATFVDTGERRIINGEIIKGNIAGLKRILRDYEGMEAVTEYIQYGIRGLQGATWLIRNIDETLSKARQGLIQTEDKNGKPIWVKADTDPLNEQLINRLNRNLVEARTMFSFYEDVATLYTIHADEFEDKELAHFNSVFKEAELKKKAVGRVANNLIAEWLYPTLENAQRNLPEERRLTKEQLQRNLYFADQDISGISYWLGSVVNSRDPINSLLGVLIKDRLSLHHDEESQTNFRIRTEYNDFLKRTGLSNTPKEYEKYAKENYLRKARIWERLGNKEVDETAKVGDKIDYKGQQGVIASIDNGFAQVDGYVDRWAFHEKYMMDKYMDDLRLFTENLEKNGRPKTDAEWKEHNDKIAAWTFANSPQQNPEKYLNPQFDKLSSDKYYQEIYNTYKDANNKYGERKLNYGIIPQAYKKTSALKERAADAKGLLPYLKNKLTDKSTSGAKRVEETVSDFGNYLFDQDQYMREQDLNLDGSYYRGVKSPFTHLIDQDKLDFRLNESVLGFQSAANTFSSLREVQANAENLKMLMEGNEKFAIKGRQIASRDKNGKILFDRFAKKPENGYAEKINRQGISFINDIFYGDGEFQSNVSLGKVNINLNSAGRQLGFLTALQNMAGNLFGGISNVTIGNIMSLGEAVGGKYYNAKNWGWAQKEYTVNVPRFLGDVTNPVKSKITQLGVLYDAIQGEFRDKYGKNITGNVLNRYATNDTFFIVNHTGEHQIQLVGMLALMDATRVKLRGGGDVSLYDAYQKKDNGFYVMRPDAIWNKSNDQEFMKTLHGISRDLNGNYAAFDKSMVQRYWWGKLALQYRKYLYSAWRSRFSGERVDYERGEVLQGYYRTFLKKFWDDTKEYNGNILKSAYNTVAGKKGFSKEQAYARRKTAFDITMIIGTTMLASSLAGMEKEDDVADKQAKERLLLSVLRLRSDMSQYTWTLPQEVYRTVSNPSASLNLVKNYADFMGQLLNDPSATYSQNGSGYQQGDSKLGNRFEKIIPLYRQWLRWQSPDQQIKYYNLINKNVQGGQN